MLTRKLIFLVYGSHESARLTTNIASRFASALPRRALIEAALLFGAALWFFRWNLGHWNGFLDFDGHYHLKVAQWIAHRGLWTDIPWLPFTILGERGPDHQWLWHLMLVPFVFIDDPAQALAWATAFNGAASVAVLGFVMRLFAVPAAPLFAVLAIAAGETITYRLMMLRGQNFAIIFIALSAWAMARSRYKTLGVLAFLFMQSYHAAVILAPIAAIGCAVHSIAERRTVLTPLIAVSGGMVLALVLNPWYPRNFELLLFHILYATVSVHGGQVLSLAGSEWYPPGWWNILRECWPAHVTLVAALAALAWRRYRVPAFRPPIDTQIAIGVALLSFALYYRASRFAEYYVPFAALAAGLAARDCWVPVRFAWLRTAGLVAWLLVAASVGVTGIDRVRRGPADHLARVSERLNELGSIGEIVFNSSWTDYMALVWWASAFRYVNGMHGHFLAYQDPGRFIVWLSLGNGTIEDPVNAIEQVFGARFAIVARQHGKLAEQLLADPRAVLRVDSPEAWLFEIRRPSADPQSQ